MGLSPQVTVSALSGRATFLPEVQSVPKHRIRAASALSFAEIALEWN